MAVIKFKLTIGGKAIDTLDELRECCKNTANKSSIMAIFKDERLQKWLEVRDHDELSARIKKLHGDDNKIYDYIKEFIGEAKTYDGAKKIFKISYNPYVLDKTTIFLNGEQCDISIGRLQHNLDQVIKDLESACKQKEYTIEFTGREIDFDDLELACEHANKDEGYKITLEHKPSFEASGVLSNIKRLESTLKDLPIPDEEKTYAQEALQKALHSEFEIAVVATMSSGKSTLINAMLQVELLPARNEATTAKIFRIKDVDGRDRFRVKSNGQWIDCTQETLEGLNGGDSDGFIEIEGDIPAIKSDIMSLVLLDTPGPNNSRNEQHKEKTYSIIKDNQKRPVILYVLNAQQIGINDDSFLINSIAAQMQDGDKQNKERFLFVLNKADAFDTEKGEKIQDAMDKCKAYLEEKGIKEPLIFPISAELARVIRKQKKGDKLTSNERKALFDCDRFNEDATLHLEKYAPLDKASKKKVQNTLENVSDDEEKALIHTGIVTLEIAINDYVSKYASAVKIGEALSAIQNISTKQEGFAKMIEEAKAAAAEAKLKGDEAEAAIEEAKKKVKEIEEEIAKNEAEKQALEDNKDSTSKEVQEKRELIERRKKELAAMEKERLQKQDELRKNESVINEKEQKIKALQEKFRKLKEALKYISLKDLSEFKEMDAKVRSWAINKTEKFIDAKLPKHEVMTLLGVLQKDISNFIVDIKTDLRKVYADKIDSRIKSIVAMIEIEIKSSLDGGMRDIACANLKDIASKHVFQQDVVVGKKTVKIERSMWNPFHWPGMMFGNDEEVVDDVQRQSFINMRSVEPKLSELTKTLIDTIEKTKNELAMQLDKVQEGILDELETIQKTMEDAENERDRIYMAMVAMEDQARGLDFKEKKTKDESSTEEEELNKKLAESDKLEKSLDEKQDKIKEFDNAVNQKTQEIENAKNRAEQEARNSEIAQKVVDEYAQKEKAFARLRIELEKCYGELK